MVVTQSEQDACTFGWCTEWLIMSFPLFRIPHTTFDTLSDASGFMHVYICFLRMIHRDESSHRHANCIPKEILNLFGSIFCILPFINMWMLGAPHMYPLCWMRWGLRQERVEMGMFGCSKGVPLEIFVLCCCCHQDSSFCLVNQGKSLKGEHEEQNTSPQDLSQLC